MSDDALQRLRQFFGAYFNQDWDLDGASCWQEVVREYVASDPRSASRTRVDLEWWLGDSRSQVCALPAAFACDYDPAPLGISDREWLIEVARELARLLSQRAI